MNGYFMVCLFFSRTIFNSRPAGPAVLHQWRARVEKKAGAREQLLKRVWRQVRQGGGDTAIKN